MESECRNPVNHQGHSDRELCDLEAKWVKALATLDAAKTGIAMEDAGREIETLLSRIAVTPAATWIGLGVKLGIALHYLENSEEKTPCLRVLQSARCDLMGG